MRFAVHVAFGGVSVAHSLVLQDGTPMITVATNVAAPVVIQLKRRLGMSIECVNVDGLRVNPGRKSLPAGAAWDRGRA